MGAVWLCGRATRSNRRLVGREFSSSTASHQCQRKKMAYGVCSVVWSVAGLTCCLCHVKCVFCVVDEI